MFHTDPGEVIPLIPREKAREAVKDAAASAQVHAASAPQRERAARGSFQPLTLMGPGVAARAAEKHVPAVRTTKPSAVVPEAKQREGTIIPAKKETPVYEITDIVRPVKYETFENLGLGKPPKKAGGGLAKLIVSAYRLLGFAILTLIVVVLVGYIGQSVFFYLNKTWVAPVAISPTDEKVIAARTQLAAQEDLRERTAAELAQADLVISTHKAFQGEFAKAIKGDRADRVAALSRLKQLANTASAARSQIHKVTSDFASSSEDKMAKEWEAGLIDRQSMLAGKYQVAQISGQSLTLAEKQAEYEQRAAELESQARALEGMVNGKGGAALSYDVLKIKREYEQSRLDLAKALGDKKVLTSSLARQDATINDLKASAYLRAMDDEATVALVPYANLERAKPGAKVFACNISFVWCHEVGKVKEVLRGEVSFKHPRRDAQMRGQMVEIQMNDKGASKEDILFVGGKPLGF